ncbi:enolase C-terminal domain-like protein [Aeromicrobium sp. UC242_57]|uniref:enolase C-terminal domain-like protein n=1 Tax=Aeromicrobium sp. UC242_57 TaxID=3374624 RepID=UPI00378A5A07
MARSADPQVTARVLAEVDRVLPERARVIVDGSWAFGLVDEPLAEVSRWPRERVAWIEDPFPAEASEKYRRFVERSPVPVSAGDEVTDPETLVRLVEHSRMDLLRIDVATIGGITAAVRLLDRLEPTGVSVSTHICPRSRCTWRVPTPRSRRWRHST